MDADDHQPVRLLVVGDSAGLRAEYDAGHGTARCVCCHDSCVFDARRRERCCFPARQVETQKQLTSVDSRESEHSVCRTSLR